ncbi:MAG TPA: hypothetical protein VKZ85_05850 [Woeseiaceae bacterium]|nr:hypothetical protein [Woeseiaceae bacterium]
MTQSTPPPSDDPGSPHPEKDLRYPLGFLTATNLERFPSHLRRVAFPRPLAVHPSTRYAVAGESGRPLAILGEAVHPDLPHLDLQGVAHHLAANESERQKEIDKLVGRFVVLHCGNGHDWRIQTDAIGMRTVFFSISDDGVVAGSHAAAVAEASTPARHREMRPFKWGYPGISTPYPLVFRLPPNCELSLTDGRLHRFFPDVPIPETSIQAAWAFAFERANATVGALARRRDLLVSLTAGLDSRTTLAAIRDNWPHVTFFTYAGGPNDRVDMQVATALAKALGLRHILVDYSDRYQANKAVFAAIQQNTFSRHKKKLACAYHSHFGEHKYLHIRSNLLELGRSNLYYKLGRRRRLEEPSTAQAMGKVYTFAGRLPPGNSSHVAPAFEHYVTASDYEWSIGKASPWDLYFIEHRMGAWHSGVLLESDVSFDTVIAFNSREILRHFMGVPQEIRCSSPHLRQKLKALLPEVKDIPINPARFPRHTQHSQSS